MQRASILLAVVALLGAVGLALGAGGAGAVPFEGGFAQMDVEPDDVSMEVAVQPDGDAQWTVEYRIRLGTDEEEQAFEQLRTDVENDTEAYTTRFRDRMVSTAATAESTTGRNMTVSNATVTAERRELPQAYGVLTYRFEWTNFAAVDGDRLRVGDAVDGLFLDDSSSLIVSWPEGYRLDETTPEPSEVRDRSVVWNGPVDFSAGQPRISVAPAGPLSGLPTAGIVALLAVLVVAGGAVAYRRRDDGSDGEAGVVAGGGGDTVTETSGDGTATDAAAGDEADAAATTAAAGGSAAAGSTDGDGDASGSEGGSDEAAPVDSDLLSNEEQVLRLIESEGGRMKQKQVAEELDWTAAKTSQVVTGLRDEGDLDGFRLGRENVLSLPDYDPEAESGRDDDDGDGSGVDNGDEERDGINGGEESGGTDESDEGGATGGD
ncbi:helix-turn-helix transcriptional regulator [Halorubrum xinjiangense]|uniref:helix-turn-helix transcriptional regulator n=1 Tax=Halorubrum xinjiangense TaxID=261291 RepID=UPI003C6F705B